MRSSTPATVLLKKLKIEFREHYFQHDPNEQAYGVEAAKALGLDPEEVFKTLIIDVGDQKEQLAVAVLPVESMLNLKSAAQALGFKRAEMASVNSAQRSSGYVLGGISPLGQRRSLPTVIHESAIEKSSIFVSGGKRGFDIEIEPNELARACNACFAAITR